MNKGIIRDAFLLFVVTLEPIAQAQLASATATYQEVYPDAASFQTTDELTAAVGRLPRH